MEISHSRLESCGGQPSSTCTYQIHEFLKTLVEVQGETQVCMFNGIKKQGTQIGNNLEFL